MKLLLTSDGFSNKTIVDTLAKLTNQPLSELKMAFIPTAANVESGDKGWLINDLDRCRKLGFAAVDIVDISALGPAEWQPRLTDANILLFGGGNTHYLMSWITKSGLAKALPRLLNERIYVGISAGSMVPTTNLVLGDSSQLYNEDIFKTEAMPGLGYVQFHVRPHYNSPHFPNVNLKRLTEIASKLPESIYAIDDQSAIVVNGEEVAVVSEGVWKKFN